MMNFDWKARTMKNLNSYLSTNIYRCRLMMSMDDNPSMVCRFDRWIIANV